MPNSHSRHVDDELSLTSETRNCSTSRKWSRIFVVHVCTYVYVLHTFCTYPLVIEDFAMEKSPPFFQQTFRTVADLQLKLERLGPDVFLWRPNWRKWVCQKNIGGNNKNNPLVNHKIASFNGYSLLGGIPYPLGNKHGWTIAWITEEQCESEHTRLDIINEGG